ncbi:hypothetical protein HOP50_01g03270 [Chloropicon primus]|uniref:Uncharacterized protein n=1 Tax=Chloropicon primus TaxID=1764295 RepID=A0A5B8MEX4_9CHLO|nr:hypothetical protein A3770_01p03380 [Chloropicon primus]UPQ97036.1 hypothetical protein HOP50_01g03270 [Chloropicon primus]|eukprot:QDZ17820.1 hypothetical protein A3770_01p03380 [Chloropicon primus]
MRLSPGTTTKGRATPWWTRAGFQGGQGVVALGRSRPHGCSRQVSCRGSASFRNGVGRVSFRFNQGEEEGSFRAKLVSFFKKGKGLDRKKIASLGASVLLSYGFVSNVNACTLITIAWVICGQTTGLSPLAAGNWKAFLGIYGGLYLSFGNLLRPIRASIAVAASPLFEKFVNFLQAKFRVKRTLAFGLTVFLINVLGSISYFALAISSACFLFRVPLLPKL